MPARRSLVPLIGVAALFLISVAFQVRFTYDSINTQLHVTEYARAPFRLNNPDGKLVSVRPEAKEAGLEDGDRPIDIEGRRVRGIADIIETIEEM